MAASAIQAGNENLGGEEIASDQSDQED